MKRTVRIVTALLLILAIMLPAAVLADHNTSAGKTYYVKTGNGKTLNLRNAMETGHDTIIGHIPYGASVMVYSFYQSDKWAEVEYNGTLGYVMTRFLSPTKPGKYVKPATDQKAEKQETVTEEMTYAAGNPPLSPDLSLRANPTTGYDWKAVCSDESVVSVVCNGFYPDDENLTGSAGYHCFRFDGLKSGTAEIVLTYAREWETDTEPLYKVTVNVMVDDDLDASIYDITYDMQ